MDKKAIILAAGMGTRLKPLTLTTHKCLTKVNGTPILYNALHCLKGIGISEAVLVVGYLAGNIKEEVGGSYEGLKVSYVENNKYSETNTSLSLKMGLDSISNYDSLYLLEGDVFFEEALLKRIEMCPYKNVTLVEKYNSILDGTFVEVGDGGFVVDWTHKSMREPGYTLEDKYKTINIYKFSKEFVEGTLIGKTNKTCNDFGGKAPAENVMREIVREDHKAIFALDAGGSKWFEIDDANDLEIAEGMFAK